MIRQSAANPSNVVTTRPPTPLLHLAQDRAACQRVHGANQEQAVVHRNSAIDLVPDRLFPGGGLGEVPTRHTVGFQILGQPLAECFVLRRMAEKAGFKQQRIDEVI